MRRSQNAESTENRGQKRLDSTLEEDVPGGRNLILISFFLFKFCCLVFVADVFGKL
jgi:hypothetical protein